jgi:uncharacterized RDD family membrane protein YckC
MSNDRVTVTGHYSGAVSRLLAAILDVVFIFVSYTLGVAGLNLLLSLFTNVSLNSNPSAPKATIALLSWAFVYTFGFLVIVGRTPGKAIIGMRVVAKDGGPLHGGRAFVRVLMMPLSFLLFGLGLLLIIFQRQHRALHDLIAGTAVVYDWGERPAELPGPLSDFIRRAQEATGGRG